MGTEEMWPYLLAFGGVPALLQLVTLPFFPEAPRYLYIDKGDTEGARKGEHPLAQGRVTGLQSNVWKSQKIDFDFDCPVETLSE